MHVEEPDKHNEHDADLESPAKNQDSNNADTEETMDEKQNKENKAGKDKDAYKQKKKTELDQLYEDAEDEIDANNNEIDQIEEESEGSAEAYNQSLIAERAVKAKYTITALEKFKRKIHDFNEQQKVNAIYQINKAEETITQEQQQEMGLISRHYKETAQRLSMLERQGMGNPFVDSEYLNKMAEMIEKRLQDEQKQFEEDKKQGEIKMDVAKKLNDDRVERRGKEDQDKEKRKDKLLKEIYKTQDRCNNELQEQKVKLKDLEQKNAEVNSNFEEEREEILSKMGLKRQYKNAQDSNKMADNIKNDKKDNNISSLMNSLKQMEKMKNKQKEGTNTPFKIDNIAEKQNEQQANVNILNDVKYDTSKDKKSGLSI